VKQANNPKTGQNERGRNEGNRRCADLSFNKRAGKAGLVVSGAVAMEELMECVTDREGHPNHQQDRQNAAKCRSRQVAGFGKS
jgi:hypothetical protein